MWGINLFSISQVEKTMLEDDPEKVELVETGGISTFSFKPFPFLYYYFTELGYRVKFSNELPEGFSKTMLLIEPPDKIDIELLKGVFKWVRAGGQLIVFTSNKHPLDRLVGVERIKHLKAKPGNLHLFLPYLYDIEMISANKNWMRRTADASHYSVFTEKSGSANLFMTFKGDGRIVLISHGEMTYGRGLKKADNVVLITRLVEHFQPNKQIHILDTQPDFFIKARGKRLVERTGTRTVKKKIDHRSLWSLLKANPISWVLAQMFVALAVFFYSSARRFGRPEKMLDDSSANLSYIRNLGSLFKQKGEASFALESIQNDFVSAATRRFNLSGAQSFHRIIEEISHQEPEVAQRLFNCEKEAFQIIAGRNSSPKSLLRVVRAIANARKELKLYD
jgi:hypothetical protein